tara:strand:- start:220 stop:504 length:285 start_codon:yes stop_codon:yes gene_type:complete
MTNSDKFEAKVRNEYNEYFISCNRDTNRKKMSDLRQDIKELNWVVECNETDIINRVNEGFGWCWYLGQRYTQFDLQKDKKRIKIANQIYLELKK